jgi:hypothetical protein
MDTHPKIPKSNTRSNNLATCADSDDHGSVPGPTTVHIDKNPSPLRLGKKTCRSLRKLCVSGLHKGVALEEFFNGFWQEHDKESEQEYTCVKKEASRAEKKVSTLGTKLALRDFRIRQECAERYHRLEYVAQQLALTQFGRPNQDIKLLCHKLQELSLEDWECRTYGLIPHQEPIVQGSSLTHEMTSEDEYEEPWSSDDISMLDEAAEWILLDDDNGPRDEFNDV